MAVVPKGKFVTGDNDFRLVQDEFKIIWIGRCGPTVRIC
jgi:hypothetical protein